MPVMHTCLIHVYLMSSAEEGEENDDGVDINTYYRPIFLPSCLFPCAKQLHASFLTLFCIIGGRKWCLMEEEEERKVGGREEGEMPTPGTVSYHEHVPFYLKMNNVSWPLNNQWHCLLPACTPVPASCLEEGGGGERISSPFPRRTETLPSSVGGRRKECHASGRRKQWEVYMYYYYYWRGRKEGEAITWYCSIYVAGGGYCYLCMHNLIMWLCMIGHSSIILKCASVLCVDHTWWRTCLPVPGKPCHHACLANAPLWY